MPRLHHALLAAALACSFTAANAAPTAYNIVSKISRVHFSLRHQGFIDLSGTVRLTPGRFVFDPEDWSRSSIQVSMPVASIDLGDAQWNNQVRGDDAWARLFMGPGQIVFRSTRLQKIDGTQGKLLGELTLAGVTRPVVLDLRFNKLGLNEVSEKPSVGFSARTVIKRSEFGLDAYLDLVGDEMAIQIQVEGTEGVDTDAGNSTDALGVKGKS